MFCIKRKTIFSNEKNFALAFYFMGEFLVCSERPGFVNTRAIGSVGQVRDGNNIASLVLGLDSIFLGGESQQFLGSPLTLQIWLMERLDMIATQNVSNYGPNNFPNRAVLKTKCQTEKDWVKFLRKKFSLLICWNCYWWKCSPLLLRTPRSNHIILVGLRRATFYKAAADGTSD